MIGDSYQESKEREPALVPGLDLLGVARLDAGSVEKELAWVDLYAPRVEDDGAGEAGGMVAKPPRAESRIPLNIPRPRLEDICRPATLKDFLASVR